MSLPATRFVGMRRWPAVCILALTAVALLASLWVELRPVPEGAREPAPPEMDDWTFYRLQVEGMQAGHSYYEMNDRLFQRIKFKPFSVFNVRPPLLAHVLAALPEATWGQWLLRLLGVVTLAVMFAALRREVDVPAALAGLVLLLGGVLWCTESDPVYAHEMWAGLLITISVAAYGLGRWPLGVAAGLLALFLRELTLPYCLIAAAFALGQRRRVELLAWLIGLLGFGIGLSIHFQSVRPMLVSSAGRSALDWFQFGGLPFVLATTRMNYFLLVMLPAWTAAVYLPLACLGLAGWRGEMGARVALTVAAYLIAFSIVGQAVNRYWGLMYTPLLTLGLLWLPAVVRDLWQASLNRGEAIHRVDETA